MLRIGLAESRYSPLEPGDRLELAVAIGMAAQGLHPQGLPLVKVVPVEQLIDDMHTDITTTLLHQIDDLGLGQIGPDQRLLGGTAGGVLDEDLAEVVVDLGVVVELPFPTPARLADPGRRVARGGRRGRVARGGWSWDRCPGPWRCTRSPRGRVWPPRRRRTAGGRSRARSGRRTSWSARRRGDKVS